MSIFSNFLDVQVEYKQLTVSKASFHESQNKNFDFFFAELSNLENTCIVRQGNEDIKQAENTEII